MDSPEVRPPGFRARRRVASAPVTPRPHTAEHPPADDPVETLYYHPNVKIVAFTSSGKALLQNTDAAREEAGTLLARSPVERTLAVDEENTVFVLQIRRPNYWRIELQESWDTGDRSTPDALREVLGMILQFEKTYCPFQRSFTVEVEEPTTPTIKKAWTPKHTPNSGPMMGIVTPELGSPASPQIARTLFDSSGRRRSQGYDLGTCNIRGLGLRSMLSDDHPLSMAGSRRSLDLLLGGEGSAAHTSFISGITGETDSKLEESPVVSRIVDDIQSRSATDTVPIAPRDPFTDNTAASIWNDLTVERPEQFHGPLAHHAIDDVKPSLERALSAPLFPTHSTSQPRRAVPETILENGDDNLLSLDNSEPSGGISPSPSQDSFHSVKSWDSVDDPSPIPLGQKFSANSGVSSSTALEIRQSFVRRRARHRSKKSESDIPTGGNGHASVPAPSNNVDQYQAVMGMGFLEQARSLPLFILAKTVEILLGPPAYLIKLMLRIAARIIAGEWRGQDVGYDDDGEQIPVHWDLSDDDEQID
ncbi:unnamed protein product [Clonostachys byssicola]|uniref:Inheritance of peroxisomes protein 1 n=1 Tax=Clonostachys byssicola TaxID=160290 RepID=A0A9N9U7N9_9HYPO|nr:unnamed protein product [Clonostachys byssicola]